MAMKFVTTKSLVIAAVLVLLTMWFLGNKSEPVIVNSNEIEKSSYTLATSSFPVKVAGVVEATDSAVISAESAGVVEFAAYEGVRVNKGEILLKQATPVADARLILSDAEQRLTGAEQAALVAAKNTATEKTEAVARSAEEIAVLRIVSGDSRVKEASAQLLVTLESHLTNILAAIDFADDNSSLFDDDGMDTYNDLVANLYGRVPDHFRTIGRYPEKSETYLIDNLNKLRSGDEISIEEVTELATLFKMQSELLADLYKVDEGDVFGNDLVTNGSDEYETYFANRVNISTDLSNLETAMANLNLSADQAAEDLVLQNQSVVVSELDKASALRQYEYSLVMADASAKVKAASSGVILAERSLGSVEAPFAGVVARKHVKVGEYVTPGQPLYTFVGEGAREVEITLPVVLVDRLAVGQLFVVGGEVVGSLLRFSTVSNGNSVAAVISITNGNWQVGESVSGALLIESGDELCSVSRSYVHFDSTGPFIKNEAGEEYQVEIVYDSGAEVLLKSKARLGEVLRPAYAVNFK